MKFSKKAIEALWREFGDCPVNDYEEILESFCGWPVFTDREEIWHWFDDQYARWGGVHALMFPDDKQAIRCPGCGGTEIIHVSSGVRRES